MSGPVALRRAHRELKRRKVYHVGAAYLTAAVVIATAVAELHGHMGLPGWTPRFVLVMLAAGMPMALILAWAYELRPEAESAPVTEAAAAAADAGFRTSAAADLVPMARDGAAVPVYPAAPVRAADRSIVVLPFDNLSSDPADAWFSDGLTEELIARLSRVRGLRVISRTSSMALRGSGKDARTIGRELGVGYVLEGSVRKAGDALRVTAQLIDATRDEHAWAETYDGVLADVFEVQTRFSHGIVEQLQQYLPATAAAQLAPVAPPPDIRVHEAYSRARYEFWRTDRDAQNRAMKLLVDARSTYGDHPLLLSGIGALHWQQYHQFGEVDGAHLEAIANCAARLFEADPQSAHGHRLSSYLRLTAGQTEDALRHLRASFEQDPSDTETLLWLAYLLSWHAGRPDLARPVAERWRSIDPLNPVSCAGLMAVHMMTGELELAMRGLDHLDALDPGNRLSGFYRSHLLAWLGRIDEADACSADLHASDPDDAMGQAVRFLVQALHGRAADAHATLTPQGERACWEDFHLPMLVAEGHAALGDADAAMRWLERAVEKGLFNAPFLEHGDALLQPLRGKPAFHALSTQARQRWDAMNRELDEEPPPESTPSSGRRHGSIASFT
jgi:TolB-like protein